MTRKLFALACLVPMLGLTLVTEEAQARNCCRRPRNSCCSQNYQVGWQQQAGYQQQADYQQPIHQASFQQGTCCQPQATCCGAQSACATQGNFQGQGFNGQGNYNGSAPQSRDQAAPAPPQEPETAAPAPQPGNE